MLNDEQADDLLRCEWLPKMHDGTVYLAKFQAYPNHGSCIFMITDTKTVWSEVVKSERLAWRFRSLNSDEHKERHRGNYDEGSFRSEMLVLVSRMHELRNFVDTEFEVSPGSHTDLAISISYQGHKWNWEVDSLGHSASSSILSRHLIIPLVVTANFSFNSQSSTPIADQSAQELQKELDKVGKIAKRNPLLGVAQALKRPRLSSSLQRVSAVVNGVGNDNLPVVIAEFPERDETMESIPNSVAQEQSIQRELASSSMKFTQSTERTDQRMSPPLFQHLESSTSSHIGSSVQVTDETLYTGPSQGKEVPGNKRDDDSRTESDGDSESPPPTKKRRVVNGSRGVKSPSPSRGTPARKKAKSSSSSESDNGGPSGSRRGTGISRVKQPVKRGGRRL